MMEDHKPKGWALHSNVKGENTSPNPSDYLQDCRRHLVFGEVDSEAETGS